MSISANGIQTASGDTFSWDDLNQRSVADQKALLNQAGLSAGEIGQVLGKLNTLEQDEFKAWVVNNTTGNGAPNERQAWLQAVKDYDTGNASQYLGAADQTSGEKGLEGSQGFERGLSGQQITQNIGLGDLTTQISGQIKANVAEGKTPQGGDPTAGDPNAMTPQAMMDYYNSIMKPAMNFYQNMVNGDMAQWGNAINAIKGATKGADTNFATPNLQMYGELQNLYGVSSMINNAFGPTYQTMANMMGQNTTIQNQKEAQGAAVANLINAIQTNPSVAAAYQSAGGSIGGLLGLTGTTGLTGTGGTAGILPNLTTNAATQSMAAAGAQAANTNKQQLTPAVGTTG